MDNSDDLTFRIIFSGDGAGRLRDKVKEKLKEFMGDYTDDTLVEYVIVLLKNGRRKEEARNELNVFLGDDSDSFVSWLWDHLRSNLNLYAQPKEEVAKPKKEDGRSDLIHSHLESEGVKSIKASKNRVSKDWKGVLRDPDEPPPLRSAVVVDIGKDDNALHGASRMKRSPSPQPLIQRKRGRNGDGGPPDERSQVKREPNLGASRRLLQFAVRDAVATSRSPSEPSLKRLRSVVSTPNEDEEHRPKIRSVAARVPKAMAVAIKAVADAAKDVVKVKPPSGNVFDRLGRSADLPDYPHEEHDGNHMDFTQVTEATVPSYYEEITYGDDLDGRVKIGNSGGHLVGNESTMVNIASVNTVKPRAVLEMENRKVVKENSNRVTVSNGNGATTPHAQREVQKTLPLTGVNNTTGRPTEDVDSRTIFVSNVHFGATKDSLSRHFNKFGDVLKVVIVTEAATGQPKGSAYVEFMRKEAAENALSLDGTSFMSRILKVVRKSSVAHQEPAQVAAPWPRVSRGSPFTASRFGRVPFPRGGSTLYRPRLPLKPGARSLQWKRDSSENVPSPTAATGAIPSPTTAARSLTYIRPEAAAAKTDANSNNA